MDDDSTHAILTSTFGFIAIILNIVVIGSILSKKTVKTPFTITLFTLSLADLMISVCQCFSHITGLLIEKGKIPDSPEMDISLTTVDSTIRGAFISSYLQILFISVQRLIATVWPLKCRRILTKFRCYFTLVIIWLISVLLIIGTAVFKFYHYEMLFTVLNFSSGVTVFIIYSLICYHIFKTRRNVIITSTVPPHQNKTVLCFSILVTVALFVCTLPFGLSTLGYMAYSHVPIWLMFLNPVLDPVIYFLFNNCKHQSAVCCHRSYRDSHAEHIPMSHPRIGHWRSNINRGLNLEP